MANAEIHHDLPHAISLPLPDRDKMSIGSRVVFWAARANLPRAGGIAKISRLSHVGKSRFPRQKSGWRRVFLNPFLARHRAGPKENGILGQKFKKRGSGSLGQGCCRKRTLGRD